MQPAVEVVKNTEMGFLKASNIFRVPRSILKNCVNHKTKQVVENESRKEKCVATDEDQVAQFC
jgi:hypothetical protein